MEGETNRWLSHAFQQSPDQNLNCGDTLPNGIGIGWGDDAMCLWVERAHLRELVRSAEAAVSELQSVAKERATDFLLQLPPAMAEPAIIFRDFPKRHGNIIQEAVGIALNNHVGGYTKTSARFPFLSGLSVEVDNFFMASNGQIFLFETKREHGQIREEGVAGRNLNSVKSQIESEIARRGRPLKHPIQICYFSYFDESFGGVPRHNQVNIGSKLSQSLIDMPIYSREDMNELIGPCFGWYLRYVDRLIGQVITDKVPELAIVSERATMQSDDISVDIANIMEASPDSEPIRFGDAPRRSSLSEDNILN